VGAALARANSWHGFSSVAPRAHGGGVVSGAVLQYQVGRSFHAGVVSAGEPGPPSGRGLKTRVRHRRWSWAGAPLKGAPWKSSFGPPP